jgi:hypothetical protein
MNCSGRRILNLGSLIWDFCVSSVGCFVFTSGFRSLSMEKEGSETGARIRAVSLPRRTLAGIGAALFLLAFVTTEAVATIRALAHRHSSGSFPPSPSALARS